jgi:Bacterial PH domain
MSVTKEVTLQSRFSRVLTVLIIAICVFTEGALIVHGDVEWILRGTAPLALAGVLAFVLFWAPLVRISPATVEFVNPLRSFTVTWPAIEDIQTRWALTIVAAGRKITAWASPAQSRYGSLGQLRRDSFGRADFDSTKAAQRRADAPSSVAGLAPMLLTQQWEEYRDAGLLGAVEGEGVQIRWHVRMIAVVSALVVLSILAAAIH